MIKRTNSVSGAWLLKRAAKLAERVRARNGAQREVFRGFIVEGKRVGGRRVATVLDPPTMIQLVGVTTVRDAATVGNTYYTRSQLTLPSRDPLRTPTAPKEDLNVTSFQLGAPARRITIGTGNVTADWISSFGGVSISPGGVLFTNRADTRGRMQFAVAGNVNSVIGRTDAVRGVGYPSGSPEPQVAPEAYGLAVHGSAVEQLLGGGWRAMPQVSQAGYDTFLDMGFTTAYHLLTVPCFIHSTPLVVEPNYVVYRVAAHVMKQLNAGDPFGERALFYFDVTIDTRSGELHTSYSGANLYRPSASADPDRHPIATTTTEPYYEPNGLLAPSFCADGALLATGRTHPYVGFSNQNYWLVLITRTRQVIEIPITVEMRPDRTIFSDDATTVGFMGSDYVGQTCYFINPFYGDRTMLTVDSATGQVTSHPAPMWYEVGSVDLGGDTQGGNGWMLTHPYSRAVHIGGGKLVFPVRVGGALGAGMWNTATGEVTVAGLTPETTTTKMNLGGCIACVSFETQAGGDAVLLLSSAGVASGGYSGVTYVSHDSGATWVRLSGEIGTSRALGVYGNGLYTVKPGGFREVVG